jgi:hypothetical protein
MANNPFETLEQKLDNIEKMLIDNGYSKAISETTPEEILLTRKEAAALLNINLVTLNKHTKSGRFLSYGFGARVLYKRSQLIEALTPINH